MKYIQHISFIILCATVTTFLANYLESVSLFVYLKGNIIGLLLTLLAINTATLGLIASKIQDLVVQKPEYNFNCTIKQMKLSLIEQITMIGLSIATLLVQDSGVLLFAHKEIICNIVLVSILLYSIDVLWDTGNAVFIVIEELQKSK